MLSPATKPWPIGVKTKLLSRAGRSRSRDGQHETACERDGDAGEEDARELHAHLEPPDEDIAAAGHDVVERTERRAAERQQECDDPDRHQARPATLARQRQRHTTMPTATRIVTIGNRPAS